MATLGINIVVIIYGLFWVTWWVLMVALWVITLGCYDRVWRFWRKGKALPPEYDGLGEGTYGHSNFNSGINNW